MTIYNGGSIANPKTGVKKDIAVKATVPNDWVDILIGAGTMVVGVAYLTVTAFRNGAKAFDAAEMKALSDAGLLSDNPKDMSVNIDERDRNMKG